MFRERAKQEGRFIIVMLPKIYSASGYISMAGLIELSVPFIFIIGARGIGKTYGAIRYEIENGKKFILMRRSQTQAALIEKPEFNNGSK